MTIAESAMLRQHPQFHTTVETLAQKARFALPEANGRIDKAVEIVLSGGVTLHADGEAVVASQSRPGTSYNVNGKCPCKDNESAPGGWCKHRIAVGIQKRTQESLARTARPIMELPAMDEPEPSAIDPRFITELYGKKFVQYVGLLAMAHERGLQELRVTWTYNDAETSLAEATAVFPFGTFTESGDATPTNVGATVRLHWRRIALTRAKARCLRDALNISMCAVEEVEEVEG